MTVEKRKPSEAAILKLLEENPNGLTMKAIATRRGVTEATTKRSLGWLEQKGLIESFVGRGTHRGATAYRAYRLAPTDRRGDG